MAKPQNLPTEPTAPATFRLPPPLPEFLPPPGGDDLEREKTYFDPERWDAEVVNHQEGDERDPVEHDLGKLESSATAALIVSDFHMADGSAGGDDFLDSHLHRDEELGIETGFFPPGQSRGKLFASVLTFALQWSGQKGRARSKLDVVLAGDVINFLELKGRGGTLLSHKHRPFYRALDAVRGQGEVYWLRGNHDYVVPSGPWKRGAYYANAVLRTLVEHGDFWDKENWPPGPSNKGSRLALEAGSAFEVHASVTDDGAIKYLMSGVDNLRPWSNDAIEAFLDRRSKHSDIAAIGAVLARIKFLGAADDSAAYQGALKRRKAKYRDWLMVQGHTHVPAFKGGVYYNTGSWISTLIAPDGEERHIESFPFVLVYVGPDGQRIEEYYTADQPTADAVPTATLHTEASINELRKEYGYAELK